MQYLIYSTLLHCINCAVHYILHNAPLYKLCCMLYTSHYSTVCIMLYITYSNPHFSTVYPEILNYILHTTLLNTVLYIRTWVYMFSCILYCISYIVQLNTLSYMVHSLQCSTVCTIQISSIHCVSLYLFHTFPLYATNHILHSNEL